MNLTNKQSVIFALVLVLLTSSTIYFAFFFNKEKDEAPKQEERQHIVPARPKTFGEGSQYFINAVRQARISISNYDIEGAEFYTRDAKALWADVIDEFQNKPQGSFKDLDFWQSKLLQVEEAINSSHQDILNNNIEEAIRGLDKAREKIEELINDPDQNEYRLFKLMKEIEKTSQASNFEEMKILLPDLKTSFAEAKTLADNKDFSRSFQELEKSLSSLDNSSPKTFAKYQSQLMPAFMEIYSSY